MYVSRCGKRRMMRRSSREETIRDERASKLTTASRQVQHSSMSLSSLSARQDNDIQIFFQCPALAFERLSLLGSSQFPIQPVTLISGSPHMLFSSSSTVPLISFTSNFDWLLDLSLSSDVGHWDKAISLQCNGTVCALNITLPTFYSSFEVLDFLFRGLGLLV